MPPTQVGVEVRNAASTPVVIMLLAGVLLAGCASQSEIAMSDVVDYRVTKLVMVDEAWVDSGEWQVHYILDGAEVIGTIEGQELFRGNWTGSEFASYQAAKMRLETEHHVDDERWVEAFAAAGRPLVGGSFAGSFFTYLQPFAPLPWQLQATVDSHGFDLRHQRDGDWVHMQPLCQCPYKESWQLDEDLFPKTRVIEHNASGLHFKLILERLNPSGTLAPNPAGPEPAPLRFQSWEAMPPMPEDHWGRQANSALDAYLAQKEWLREEVSVRFYSVIEDLPTDLGEVRTVYVILIVLVDGHNASYSATLERQIIGPLELDWNVNRDSLEPLDYHYRHNPPNEMPEISGLSGVISPDATSMILVLQDRVALEFMPAAGIVAKGIRMCDGGQSVDYAYFAYDQSVAYTESWSRC